MLTTATLVAAQSKLLEDIHEDEALLKRFREGDNVLADYGISQSDLDEYVHRVKGLVDGVRAHLEETEGNWQARSRFYGDPFRALDDKGVDHGFLDADSKRLIEHAVQRRLGSSKCSSCELGVEIAIIALGATIAVALLIVATVVSVIAIALAAATGGTAAAIILAVGAVVTSILGVVGVTFDTALAIAAAVFEDLPNAICKSLGKCKHDSLEDVPLDPEIQSWDGVEAISLYDGGSIPAAAGDVSVISVRERLIMVYTTIGNQVCWAWTFRDTWVGLRVLSYKSGSDVIEPPPPDGQKIGIAHYDGVVYLAVPTGNLEEVQFFSLQVPESPANLDSIDIGDDPWQVPDNWDFVPCTLGDVSNVGGGLTMAFFESRAYLGLRDTGDGNQINIYAAIEEGHLGPGTNWQPNPGLGSLPVGDWGTATLVVNNGQLYAFWLALRKHHRHRHHHRIYFMSYNGAAWTTPSRVIASGRETTAGGTIAAASLGGKIYLMFRGKNDDFIHWVVGEPGAWTGGGSWTISKPETLPDKGTGRQQDEREIGEQILVPQTIYVPALTSRVMAGTEDQPDRGRVFLVYAEKNSVHTGANGDNMPFWSLG